VVVNQRQWRPLELKMMRLQIDSATPIICHHGLVPLSSGEQKICLNFINTFMTLHTSLDNLVESLKAAYEETEVEYTDVYSSKLESAVSILLASETQYILDGDIHSALGSHAHTSKSKSKG